MSMEILNDNWLIEQPIDLEYKQYKLLAYQKEKTSLCDDKIVYPSLSDIIEKHKYVSDFLLNTNGLESFAKELKGFDLINKKAIYETKLNDSNIEEIKEIATLGKDIFTDLLKKYKLVYNEIESTIDIIGSKEIQFNHMGGFMVVKKGLKNLFYDFLVEQLYYPEPMYSLRLSKISEKNYFQERFNRNIFDVYVVDSLPYESASLPILKRKFLQYILA